MDQPWLAITLVMAAGALALGIAILLDALRRRREGPTTRPPQVRYQAPPVNNLDAPPTQTYRRTPLNHESHPLHAGIPVVLRYDLRDPRRVVVVHTKDGRPGKVSYSATANMTWGIFFVLFGLAMGVGAFL
ncbi:hypothetical protein ACIA6T_30765 [Streptomyces sp. NPDC051740]|uniref:hypothetical protein n=1 Tax=Streptomyces sp. NPDC051740 TaxID=3365673 RepID=UPI0037BBCB9B